MNEDEIFKLAKAIVDSTPPFYGQPEFWISAFIGIVGIGFSVKAYMEAKAAKIAANQAGKTVKIQSIIIELTEIPQRLDKLNYELTFSEARDLLSEISRRTRRLIAPFQESAGLSDVCNALKFALDDAKLALEGVRPQNTESESQPNAVYFAMEGHFSNISGVVAEIMGLFEKRTIEVD
ncbi:hypothetical protein L9G74_19085 [Shewanella sp. C32]|uniref:Uncharacterized protein n=1 Tax=Shewanella electrica TaxID=515560 RepID=A0ABT2FQE7_9GAMM|nr:hypothetical protein [Shewanella electrica]MCH1926865.1 hypothetical protein [Shewanella electrica]MCS4558545.1 hypothetical protein [Shewanella electrica]